jgi:hypothetical protein
MPKKYTAQQMVPRIEKEDYQVRRVEGRLEIWKVYLDGSGVVRKSVLLRTCDTTDEARMIIERHRNGSAGSH